MMDGAKLLRFATQGQEESTHCCLIVLGPCLLEIGAQTWQMCCSSWGDVVVWGSHHKTGSAEECCKACQNYKKPTEDSLSCNGMAFIKWRASLCEFLTVACDLSHIDRNILPETCDACCCMLML